MDKQKVKIIILSITALTIVASGWYMYQRLQEQQKAFEVDIYSSVPSFSVQVINISRNYYFDQLYKYNNDFEFLIDPAQKYLSYPIIISTFRDGSSILLSKVSGEQANQLNKLIQKKIAARYAPQVNTYRGIEIEMYSLSNNKFLSTTINRGIFAVSMDYKAIEYFIDTDSTNSYYTSIKQQELVNKFRKSSYISIYQRLDSCNLLLDYKVSLNKDVMLEGYILPMRENMKLRFDSTFIDKVYLPKSYSVDSCAINDSTLVTTVKIMLNKIE